MMCRVVTTQTSNRFQKISRSVRISGQSTSIRLEAAFWSALDDMATVEGLSTSKLIGELYEEVMKQHGRMSNFASTLRTVCLLYQEERSKNESCPTAYLT